MYLKKISSPRFSIRPQNNDPTTSGLSIAVRHAQSSSMYFLSNLRWWNALIAFVGLLILVGSYSLGQWSAKRAATTRTATSLSYSPPGDLLRQSKVANYRVLGGTIFAVGLLWTLAPFSSERPRKQLEPEQELPES
jgi:hypothetical protein